MEKMEVPVSIVGQKRTYIDATQIHGKEAAVGGLLGGGSGKGPPMDLGGTIAVDQQLKGL